MFKLYCRQVLKVFIAYQWKKFRWYLHYKILTCKATKNEWVAWWADKVCPWNLWKTWKINENWWLILKTNNFRCFYLLSKDENLWNNLSFVFFTYLKDVWLSITLLIEIFFFDWKKRKQLRSFNKSYIWKPHHLMCLCILIIVDSFAAMANYERTDI